MQHNIEAGNNEYWNGRYELRHGDINHQVRELNSKFNGLSEEYVNKKLEEKETMIIDDHKRDPKGDYGQGEILGEPEGDQNDYLSFYNEEEEEVKLCEIIQSSEDITRKKDIAEGRKMSP